MTIDDDLAPFTIRITADKLWEDLDMDQEDKPLIAGGQGRTARSVTEAAWIVGACLAMALIGLGMALLGWCAMAILGD